MKTIKMRKWIKPYIRRNPITCKKKFTKIRGHYITVNATVNTTISNRTYRRIWIKAHWRKIKIGLE